MSKARRLLAALLVLFPVLSGCWNYSEVDDMSIVAGVAIDKNREEGGLVMTTELVDTKSGLDQGLPSYKILSISGNTIFECARNMISMTGKKLFWSHSKTIILSEELARNGLIKVIDWYSRDTETRSDVYVFVSDEKNAREVLSSRGTTDSILSFELAQMMRDEPFTSTAPVVEIWDFIDKLETNGASAVAPLIYTYEKNGQKYERVNGTAVFKRDRMVGKLDGPESKSMLFVRDKIKGGVLAVNNKEGKPTYSLEILSSKTKLKPRMVNGKLHMEVDTVTKVGLDEVMTTDAFNKNESLKAIQQRAAEKLQEDLENVIRKAQQEYDADIFGFGQCVHENLPKVWREMEDRWPEEFARLDVTVHSKIMIESTAKTSRAIKLGD
ncbi:Ger(x)C family spore germination protein [Paenibacillus sp. NFR01]|uniref:Ger(x)C family spore germination protein n=1 Tax=Paenibacillus sp. NFR01 TaxID=1566279 RepID=UPI0008CB2985|nr:Ger(x)C family spore germination protein [Paenibacillus sp. NFR01]SEU29491.1 spore germination protein KC [Paenibacillus sp. NFR01]